VKVEKKVACKKTAPVPQNMGRELFGIIHVMYFTDS